MPAKLRGVWKLPIIDFINRLRAGPAATPAALGEFIARRGAYVAQKTVLDYCRVKSGRQEKALFADADFQVALAYCRWQTFIPALGDVTALAEAWLRPHAAGREAALAEALAQLHDAALAAETIPDDAREAADAAPDMLRRRLAEAQRSPPPMANHLPLMAEAPLLATIPIHAEQRVGETVAIKGALRFHIVSTQQEMERGFDGPKLALALSM